MIIAIDGVAGAGKSSVAKKIAQIKNFKFLSSGEIYRAIAKKFDDLNLKDINYKNLKSLISNLNIKIKFQGAEQQTLLDEVNVSPIIHTPKLSQLSSKISQYMVVRSYANKVQYRCAKDNDLVVEGRDVTTVVFPNADLKIYMTADAHVRAERRLKQLNETEKSNIKLEDIEKAIIFRDIQDTTRKKCALKIAKDAVVIDSTNLTIDQVVDKIIDAFQKKE